MTIVQLMLITVSKLHSEDTLHPTDQSVVRNDLSGHSPESQMSLHSASIHYSPQHHILQQLDPSASCSCFAEPFGD